MAPKRRTRPEKGRRKNRSLPSGLLPSAPESHRISALPTGKRARGLAGLCRFTAGGDFHPALRRKKHTPVMAHVKKSGYKTGLFPKYGKRPGHELVRQFNAGKGIILLPT